jgi:hypothetical protein
MKIGIDIDGTINASEQSVRFFRVLTRSLISEHDIYIISNREPDTQVETEEEVSVLGIRFNKLVITENKSQYIQETGISVLFENEDEMFLDLPQNITVFKIREEGNFDFAEKKWIGSKRTTKMIDE